MSMRVSLAGRVEIDVVHVDLSRLGRPGRLFFAYLVCERERPVPKDELAEVLWGEDELPRSWQQMLRGHATKLRSALAGTGPSAAVEVISVFGACEVRLPAGAVVDVEEAGGDVERALAALREGRTEDAYQAAAAATAVAARGFLPGWSGIWVERRQAELRELPGSW